jgi:hypothetical protein
VAPTPDDIMSTAEREQLAELLDDDQMDRLTRLMEEPEGHIDALRADIDLQAAIARADIVPRLRTWFSPDDRRATWGWAHDPERSGAVGPAAAVVEWTFWGAYPAAGSTAPRPNTAFNGVLALGQPLELHGVTFMGIEAGAFRLRRYVDWAGLYEQLGLSVNWRTPLGAAEWRRAGPA